MIWPYITTAEGTEPEKTADNYVATFVTDASGNGYVKNYNTSKHYALNNVTDGNAYKLSGIPVGSYLYIKETVASDGCEFSDTAYYLHFTEDNMTQTVTSKETVKHPYLPARQYKTMKHLSRKAALSRNGINITLR